MTHARKVPFPNGELSADEKLRLAVQGQHPAVAYFCTLFIFVLDMTTKMKEGIFMQKKQKIYAVRVITTAAMLAALSAVVGIVCKNLFTFNIYYRITFENAPVILSGLLFGPAVGGAVAVCADTVSCLLSTNPAVNPIITCGAAAVGVLSGAVPYIIRKKGPTQTAVAIALAHLIGQVGIKSVAKMKLGMPWQGIFIGMGISLAVGILEFWLIHWLRSQKALAEFMGGNGK